MANLAFIDTRKRIDAGPVPLRRANGGRVEIPALGFGTWELTGSTGINAVSEAIETGYRHFDTARA